LRLAILSGRAVRCFLPRSIIIRVQLTLVAVADHKELLAVHAETHHERARRTADHSLAAAGRNNLATAAEEGTRAADTQIGRSFAVEDTAEVDIPGFEAGIGCTGCIDRKVQTLCR
jgi:hypothetical protein